jgi:TRAP-type C4-dicarboxylate transport system substrate-binding protein
MVGSLMRTLTDERAISQMAPVPSENLRLVKPTYARWSRRLVFSLIAVSFLIASRLVFSAPTLEVAYGFEGEPEQVRALERLAEEARRRGFATLMLRPASSLADSDSILAATRAGTVDLAIVKYADVASIDNRFAVFSVPFLFRDQANLQKVLFGEPGTSLLGGLPDDLVGIGWWPGPFLNLESNRTVALPEDLAGQSFAMTTRPNEREEFGERSTRLFADALGVPIKKVPQNAFVDVWNSGQPLVIEGALSQFTGNRPTTPSITLTRHKNDGYVVVANRAKWSVLPTEFRDRMSALLKDYYVFLSGREEQSETQELHALAESHEAAIFSLTEKERSRWREGNKLVYELGLDAQFVNSIERLQIATPVSTTAPPTHPTWNSWITDDSNNEGASLKLGRLSYLNLDLSRYAYAMAYAAPMDAAAAAALKGRGGELYVVPISFDGNVEAAAGFSLAGQTLKVAADRMDPRPEDAKWLGEFNDNKLTRIDLSAKVAMGNVLRWRVKATREGCATVAFVVWDEARATPLDQVLVEFPVLRGNQESGSCPQRMFETPRGPAYRVPTEQPMHAGLETFLRGGYNGMPLADIGLHYFESEDISGKITSIAVMVDRRQLSNAPKSKPGAGVYSWQLASPLSRYISMPAGLAKSLGTAHDNTLKNREHPFADVSSEFADVIFSGASPSDSSMAAVARADFRDTVHGIEHPAVVVRLYDGAGKPLYLPLRLLAAGGSRAIVDRKFDVIQVLPNSTPWQTACVQSWHVARPAVLQDAEPPASTELLSAAHASRTSIDLLDTHEKLRAYLAGGPIHGESTAGGEGLILLAHHDAGSLSFNILDTSPPRILSAQISRQFPAGSVGVLVACSTSGPSQETSAIVDRLAAYGGIESVILSTFPIDTQYGVDLALEIERRVLLARAGPSRVLMKEILDQAVDQVAKAYPGATAFQKEGLRDEGLEMQIVGNSNLRLCP